MKELKPIRLHLGNGDVYLRDNFINIDFEDKDSILVSDFTKETYLGFLRYSTTVFDRYYSKPVGALKGKIVCDRFDDIRILDNYKIDSVDEIVVFHVLEHLTMKDARDALLRWSELLKKGGVLRVCVPDIMEICNRILNTRNNGDAYLSKSHSYRLLFGTHNRNSELDSHKSAWAVRDLEKIFKFIGLTSEVLTSPTNWKFNPSVYILGKKL